MEAELQVRVESSQKQAHRVVEICEGLRRTVDQLKTDLDTGIGERKEGAGGKMGKCQLMFALMKCDILVFLARERFVAGSE